MPVTYLQTVDISCKGAPSVKEIDICPIGEVGILGYKSSDGSTTLMFDNVTIQWFPNDTIKTWIRKPSINEAFRSKAAGSYWEFKSDGSVYASLNGGFYYWSSPILGDYIHGSKIYVHVCPGDNGRYYFDDEICYCYLCIKCGSKMGSDNKFCSRSCQLNFYST